MREQLREAATTGVAQAAPANNLAARNISRHVMSLESDVN